MSWAPDGQSITYLFTSKGADQWMLPLSGDRKPVALLDTTFTESHSQVSPDGKWLAYHSNETGRAEIYVRPFATGSGKWQVSLDGGYFARWRADGHELFYLSTVSNGKMMAVDVKSSGTTFDAATPRALFESGYINLNHTGNYDTYAVTPDGQRFLIPRPQSSVSEENASAPIGFVVNWTSGIK